MENEMLWKLFHMISIFFFQKIFWKEKGYLQSRAGYFPASFKATSATSIMVPLIHIAYKEFIYKSIYI